MLILKTCSMLPLLDLIAFTVISQGGIAGATFLSWRILRLPWTIYKVIANLLVPVNSQRKKTHYQWISICLLHIHWPTKAPAVAWCQGLEPSGNCGTPKKSLGATGLTVLQLNKTLCLDLFGGRIPQMKPHYSEQAMARRPPCPSGHIGSSFSSSKCCIVASLFHSDSQQQNSPSSMVC